MGTNIRPEVKKLDEYHIPKERYYELKHFCLQYPFWKSQYAWISNAHYTSALLDRIEQNCKNANPSDETSKYAIMLDRYGRWISMVETAASKCDNDPNMKDWVIDCVTRGHSYVYLSGKERMPYSKYQFFKAYRKFFWILSHIREDWDVYRRNGTQVTEISDITLKEEVE